MTPNSSSKPEETVTITVGKEDACAIAMGPLPYAAAKMEGNVDGGGSPMAVRRALADALAEKGWWPGA